MADWARLLVSPHLVDAIVALTVLEAAVLFVVRRRVGRHRADPVADRDATGSGCPRIRPVEVVLLLLPGLCLMLALRAALDGAPWPWVPAALVVALVAHVADVWKRWFGPSSF